MDRRTLLKAGAWAAPVIVSTTVVPAMTVSPTVTPSTASVDTVGEYPALRVETVEGGALPAGTYIFSAAGFTPTAETVLTEPALPGSIEYSGADAVIVLGDGNALSSFTVYIVTSALGSDVDRTATLTASLPLEAGGGGATVELFEPAPQLNAPSGFFGPDGSHWPTRTPWVHDAFDSVVEVDPVWSEIAAAIAAAGATSKVKVLVRPGAFSAGGGSGSTRTGDLRDVGSTGRDWRVLVTPRDGWGSVTSVGTVADGAGYAFVNLAGVALIGFDFSTTGVVVRNCRDVAIGWSTFGRLNGTSNDHDGLSDVEMVECVLPDLTDNGVDRMALRVANDYSASGVSMRGCYVAPAYKVAGSSAHCDTLQTSRSSGAGNVSDISIEDSVFYASSSAVFMAEHTQNVSLVRSAFIGGLRGTGRYPIADGLHLIEGENTLWGQPVSQGDLVTGVAVSGGLILGSIRESWQFDSVADVITTDETPPAPATGAFTVDVATYGEQGDLLPQEWYDANCPLPDAARLSTVWSALA
ncbi:hypothetical protein [Microbacterium sp. MTN4-26]|uniref:hypothetical protein n=1 Tax=unclassified Microbacterium TaxID=2609290 RepID=UPI0036F2B34E